jgi:SAM-dependent methyltransferase
MMEGSLARAHDATSPEALAAMLQLMSGHAIVQSLVVVTELGIPDLLAKGPKTAAELAGECAAHEHSLYRLLRALSAIGIFSELRSTSRFALNAMSECLRSDHPQSLRDFVCLRGHSMYWKAWAELRAAVKTGEAAFWLAHDVSHYEYLEQNPEIARVFHRGVRSLGSQAASTIATAYDFSKYETVLDVGGGEGVLVAAVLKAYPSIRAILFDLPSIVDQSRGVLREAGVSHRCVTMAGDFFIGVPKGADLLILSRVLHNWGDEDALAIMKNCRSALAPNARLLIVEYLIADGKAGIAAKLFDLQMMVYFGRARERPIEDYRTLLHRAGFKLQNVLTTPVGLSLLEATCE